MRQLFYLIYKYRVLFIFLLLEIGALWLVVNRNSYQRVALVSSANEITGSVDAFTNDVSYYVQLRNTNDTLMNENARLRQLANSLYNKVKEVPSESINRPYNFIPARVVNNSVFRNNNYITIDKGTEDGIAPGMGIISSRGVVGQVKACSKHFSTVYSVLHTKLLISSRLERLKVMGTTKWDTGDPDFGSLLYIPRNVEVQKGDSVVTSGYNSVFPESVLIGTVEKVEQLASESFLAIEIRFATDFQQLTYVYAVNYKLKEERKALEEATVEQ